MVCTFNLFFIDFVIFFIPLIHTKKNKNLGDDDIKQIFKALKEEEMLEYPYFYVAVDGWLDAKVIQSITNDYTNYQGIIGTLPWQPVSSQNITYDYDNNLTAIYEKANMKYTEIEEWYYMKYGNNSDNDDDILEEPLGTRLIYAYDSTMAFVKVLEILEDKYGLNNIFKDDNFDLIGNISNIILNDISFESVTGLVTFDEETGDRDNGLYSFGYITEDGDIEYFGYSYQYEKPVEVWGGTGGAGVNATASTLYIEKFNATINEGMIVWPSEFEKRGIIPRSSIKITYELSKISEGAWISMTVIACLGIFAMIGYILFIIFIAKEKSYRNKSNFKLNMVIYTGVIMAYLNMILSGLDEREYEQGSHSLDVLCNVRAWFLVISFTLIFTPIFAKTYKLSRIFTELLITKTIPDKVMLIRVFIALGIDLLLLIIFVSIGPFTRDYEKGDTKTIDKLQEKQFIYGVCRISNPSINYAFYVCIGVWKLIELIFGIYVSIIVSRMSFKSQIWTMSFIVVIFCVDVILIAFGPTDDPNFTYLVLCITTILIINIVIFEKYAEKLKRKWNKEEDIELNDEHRMKKLLKDRLQEIAKAENWASEMSITQSTQQTGDTNNTHDSRDINQQNGGGGTIDDDNDNDNDNNQGNTSQNDDNTL